MKSVTTKRFRQALRQLTPEVQRQARKAYRLFSQDPYHPSLRFKRVHPTQPIYSVRINRDVRALGVRTGDTIVWFWIGSHADYETLLQHL